MRYTEIKKRKKSRKKSRKYFYGPMYGWFGNSEGGSSDAGIEESDNNYSKLGDLCEIRINFPDADFWLIRKHNIDVVGKPVKEFDSERIGIKVIKTDVLDSRYLYYLMQYVFNSGYWKPRAHGLTRLVNITTNDVKNIQLGSKSNESKNIPITEAISLTRYQASIKKDITDSIEECLYTMVKDMDGPDFSTLKGVENDETLFSQLIRPTIKKYLEQYLVYYIEKKLTVKARDMFLEYLIDIGQKRQEKTLAALVDPKLNSKIKRPFVKFHTITDLGHATPTTGAIVLSWNYYYTVIVDRLAEIIVDIFYDSYYSGNQNQLTALKLMFQSSGRNIMMPKIIDYVNRRKVIDEMIGTFTHEVVHVAQHAIQQALGREKTEYRSYIEKNKEKFWASFAKDLAGQYINPELMNRLHAGSPQEIGAFVHNIALNIIKSYYFDETPLDELKYYTDIKSPYYRENTTALRTDIVHAVRDHLVAKNIRPESRIEKEIYKRYMKMVYLEIQRYLEWLIKFKTQEQTTST